MKAVSMRQMADLAGIVATEKLVILRSGSNFSFPEPTPRA
jgi:hypothetical protein